MTAVAYAHPTISRYREPNGSRVLRPSASSGACAPRWTCSHVMSASRVPRSATLWRSLAGAYGMTASPTAFLGQCDTDGAVGVDRRPPGLHDR
jgi:hypothetical protein